MDIQNAFKLFAEENLKWLPHPTSKKNKHIVIENISELSDLLFFILESEINEDSIARLKENFQNDFEKIYSFNVNEMASAIEGLAATFESFLKKIALLKFEEQKIIEGDRDYKGINKCSLYELIEGFASRKDEGNENIPERREFPTRLVPSSGTEKEILDYMRAELRNAVHYAKSYNRIQLISYSNIVLGSYLIAIKENEDDLKKKLFKEFDYLTTIVKNNKLHKINSNYVDLFGGENENDFESIQIQQLDGQTLFDLIDNDIEISEDEPAADELTNERIARIDTILNISSDVNRFIIIGEPGSGKTTSLQKIYFENANKFLNKESKCGIPILIKASNYSKSFSFLKLIDAETNFMPFHELAQKYNVLILIDGLNEIEEQQKRNAFREINGLMQSYPNVNFILSTRKFGFENKFNLPVYELKNFNDTQIKELIYKLTGKNDIKSENIWNQIDDNRAIRELASNPLMLTMIIKVSEINNQIPPNKGILYNLFYDAILEREKKVYVTDIETKKDILSHIAFWMRNNGIYKSIKKVKLKDIIIEKLKSINSVIDVNKLINEIIDNRFFLEKNQDLEFYHETIQEYFVALELRNIFYLKSRFFFDVYDDKWIEPLIICSDLLNSHEDKDRFFDLLFISEKTNNYKRIYDFAENDMNRNIDLACRIAYNLKKEQPSLYRKAEMYLNNYLIIWKLKFKTNGDVIDFKYLVKSAAILSSERIFEKLFYSLDYLEYWFHKPSEEGNIDSQENDKTYENKYNSLCEIFVKNLSDYIITYKVLSKNKIFFDSLKNISKSLNNNLDHFNNYLFENTPINQLYESFKDLKSNLVLIQIGKSDLGFFTNNYLSVFTEYDNKYFNFIINYHLHNVVGKNILIEGILNKEISIQYRINIIEKLINRNIYIDEILSVLSDLLENNDPIIITQEIKIILNKVPYTKLKKYNLSQIYQAPQVFNIPKRFEIIENTDDFYYISIEYDLFFLENYKNVQVFYKTNLVSISFENTFVDTAKQKTIVFSGETTLIDNCINKYSNQNPLFVLLIKDHDEVSRKEFRANNLMKSKTNPNLIIVAVDDKSYDLFKTIIKETKNFNILIEQEFQFKYNGLSLHHLHLIKTKIYKRLNNELVFDESDNKLQIQQLKIELDKFYLYHRDMIRHNKQIMNFIYHNLDYKDTRVFIYEHGLSYAFLNHNIPITIGKIIDINHNSSFYKILCFKNNTFRTGYYTNNNDELVLKAGDNVVIESNSSLSFLDNNDIPEQYIKYSIVEYLDYDTNTGFISGNEKDFYFLPNECQYKLNVNDVVKFIPGVNNSSNHRQKPMAFCVNKCDKGSRQAKVYRFDVFSDFIELYLIDSDSSEQLYSRIYNHVKIINFDGKINNDDEFTYFIPLKNTWTDLHKLKRVFIISKI